MNVQCKDCPPRLGTVSRKVEEHKDKSRKMMRMGRRETRDRFSPAKWEEDETNWHQRKHPKEKRWSTEWEREWDPRWTWWPSTWNTSQQVFHPTPMSPVNFRLSNHQKKISNVIVKFTSSVYIFQRRCPLKWHLLRIWVFLKPDFIHFFILECQMCGIHMFGSVYLSEEYVHSFYSFL